MHQPTDNLSNVGPSFSMFYVRHILHTRVEKVRHGACSLAPVKSSANFKHLSFSERRPTMFRSLASLVAQHIVSMLGVLRRSYPFKVFQSWVVPKSIFVIGEWLGWINTVKSEQNNSVNSGNCPFPTKTKTNPHVSIFRYILFENAAVCLSVRHYTSLIANAVSSFKTNYWTPLFDWGKNWIRHADLSLLRVDVQAGDTATTVRQPVYFVACLFLKFNPKTEVSNGGL